jgi:hypothetical protein
METSAKPAVTIMSVVIIRQRAKWDSRCRALEDHAREPVTGQAGQQDDEK